MLTIFFIMDIGIIGNAFILYDLAKTPKMVKKPGFGKYLYCACLFSRHLHLTGTSYQVAKIIEKSNYTTIVWVGSTVPYRRDLSGFCSIKLFRLIILSP